MRMPLILFLWKWQRGCTCWRDWETQWMDIFFSQFILPNTEHSSLWYNSLGVKYKMQKNTYLTETIHWDNMQRTVPNFLQTIIYWTRSANSLFSIYIKCNVLCPCSYWWVSNNQDFHSRNKNFVRIQQYQYSSS